MREIKFRAWLIDRYVNEKQIMEFNLGMLIHATGYKFEQYTGLKDKNGKEIY